MKEFLQSGALISIEPGLLLLGWGKRLWSSEPSEECFYFPDFFLTDEKPWFTHEYQRVVPVNELAFPKNTSHLSWEMPDYSLFAERFHALQELKLKKGVPYAFSRAKGNGVAQCLGNLLSYVQEYPVFAYGFWDETQGMLGATPERLFSLSDDVKSVALAGTGESFEEKEQYEHDLVIEGIEAALAPFGQVEVNKTEVAHFGTLSHLKTPIQLKPKRAIHFNELVQALHPTPALGVYPRKEGWPWLLDYQAMLPRGRFGAPVGVWRENRSECYVAIRNVQWQGEQWHIGAGCGVVSQSDLELEWREVNLKIAAVKEFLFGK